jgi:hypothetical protein
MRSGRGAGNGKGKIVRPSAQFSATTIRSSGTIAGTLLISAAQKTAHGFARQVGNAARTCGDTNPPQSGELLFRHSDADDP